MSSWKDNLEHEEFVSNSEYTYTGQFGKRTLNGTLSQRQMKHNVLAVGSLTYCQRMTRWISLQGFFHAL